MTRIRTRRCAIASISPFSRPLPVTHTHHTRPACDTHETHTRSLYQHCGSRALSLSLWGTHARTTRARTWPRESVRTSIYLLSCSARSVTPVCIDSMDSQNFDAFTHPPCSSFLSSDAACCFSPRFGAPARGAHTHAHAGARTSASALLDHARACPGRVPHKPRTSLLCGTRHPAHRDDNVHGGLWEDTPKAMCDRTPVSACLCDP